MAVAAGTAEHHSTLNNLQLFSTAELDSHLHLCTRMAWTKDSRRWHWCNKCQHTEGKMLRTGPLSLAVALAEAASLEGTEWGSLSSPRSR